MQWLKAQALEPDACLRLPCITLTLLLSPSVPVFSSIKYDDEVTQLLGCYRKYIKPGVYHKELFSTY